MRAAIFVEPSTPLVVRDDIAIEEPGPGEVLVRVAACSICHSDLSAIDGTFPVPTPLLLGHEAAGVVDAVGPGVTLVAVGDHVILTPAPPCGQCYGCVRGQPGTCVSTAAVQTFARADGTTGLTMDGEPVYRGLGVAAFGEFVLSPEEGAIPIAPDIPLDVACVIGCGVQTGVGAVVNTAGVAPGDSIAVIGAGGVGLSVVQGARIAGASTIVVSDPAADRRAAARALGATHVVDPADATVGEVARELTAGRGVDHAFEVVGRSSLVLDAIDAVRAGGSITMVGAPGLDDTLSIEAPVLFAAAEKRLLGCFLGSSNARRDIPRLVDLWQSGRLDLGSLITNTRPLTEVNEAFGDLAAGRGIRTVLLP